MPKPGSELPTQVLDVLKTLESKATLLENEAKSINEKGKGKLEKIRVRLQHTESAKKGGLLLKGLITKFQEAHKTKNKIVVAKVTDYIDSGSLVSAAVATCRQQVGQIRDHGKDYPNYIGVMKTLQTNLMMRQTALAEAAKAYKTARTEEKAVYELYTKYINEKPEMEKESSKEYKEFKSLMKEQLNKLMSDD